MAKKFQEGCEVFDPRCWTCTEDQGCLECIDLQLLSIRRSGRRKRDRELPFDELRRQFSRRIEFGSQSPLAFEEAETYAVVPANLSEKAKECHPGLNGFKKNLTCSPANISNVVCGHQGTVQFKSPLYEARENLGSVRINVVRSGGGVGEIQVA